MWLLGCKGALVRLLDGWALRPDKDWMGRIVTRLPLFQHSVFSPTGNSSTDDLVKS